MPAKSKSQQRLFGMLHAYNKGELHGSKSLMRKMKSMSGHISDEDARHFAETPHKGLPEKKASVKTAGQPDYGSPYLAYAKGLLKGLIDKDTLHDAWAGANNASAQALSTLATIPTLGFDNSLSSWIRSQKMPYSSASDTAAQLADSSGDMSGSALALAAGKAVIPKNLPKITGRNWATRGAKSFVRSMPTWGFYDPIISKSTDALLGAPAVESQEGVSTGPSATSGLSDIKPKVEQIPTPDSESIDGWKSDAIERLEKMSPLQEPDPVDLSSAPEFVPGQPGSAIPAYLRSGVVPEEEPDIPVSLRDVVRLLRPAAATGAGLGALAGGTLGYALTDKKRPTWKKIRNTALAAIAAGALGGLSGSAYKLYTATRG